MTGLPLRSLPVSARVLLTAFLALTGTGYLFALAQIYVTHEKRDGKAGLTFDDLRATYHGLTVEVPAGETGKPLPSRFLEMIEGDMREYFKKDEEFEILYAWLAVRATQEAFQAGEKKKTPAYVFTRRCLRCHAAEGGEDVGRESPFGPDIFTADFGMISEFTSAQAADLPAGQAMISPTSAPRLLMLTHTHMLAIPMFTLIVGLLFVFTNFPAPVRGVVAVIPMFAILLDFAGWWLARCWEPALLVLAVSGGAFGLCFAVQLLWVAGALWLGRKPT